MQFRGNFLRDGRIILRHADVNLERRVRDGIEDWRGSLAGPAPKLRAGESYHLVLNNGRCADIKLDLEDAEVKMSEKVYFDIAGGFR
jgi:hypothetical protein